VNAWLRAWRLSLYLELQFFLRARNAVRQLASGVAPFLAKKKGVGIRRTCLPACPRAVAFVTGGWLAWRGAWR